MDTPQKYIPLPVKRQMLLIEMLGRQIVFNTQKTYKNKTSFKRAIGDMIKRNLVSKEQKKTRPFESRYSLTLDGAIYVEQLKV